MSAFKKFDKTFYEILDSPKFRLRQHFVTNSDNAKELRSRTQKSIKRVVKQNNLKIQLHAWLLRHQMPSECRIRHSQFCDILLKIPNNNLNRPLGFWTTFPNHLLCVPGVVELFHKSHSTLNVSFSPEVTSIYDCPLSNLPTDDSPHIS